MGRPAKLLVSNQATPALQASKANAPLLNIDQKLRRAIHETTGSPEFWSFAAAKNGFSHCYFRYPAMMVAEMQHHLMRLILSLQPNAKSLIDPFAGSGTTALEGMFLGLDIDAHDINPLALLLCKTKAVLCAPAKLTIAAHSVLALSRSDSSSAVEANFSGLKKWFSPRTIRELSALRRAIRATPNVTVRRFLWVALAETVRQTSRSRTSTYKLHIRPTNEHGLLPRPFEKFEETVKRNIALQRRTRQKLLRGGLATSSTYKGSVRVKLHDARRPFPRRYDLVVTSPPYGDNQSTVPYGQSAFLPLQWIDLDDIDKRVKATYLRTTWEIDNRSLGGKPISDVERQSQQELSNISPAFSAAISSLPQLPKDRRQRVLRFVQDLDASLRSIAAAANKNAYFVFTLGNRRVANQEIPLNEIVSEILSAYGVRQVLTVTRRIPRKRMATRNNVAATIRTEHVLILRKVRMAENVDA